MPTQAMIGPDFAKLLTDAGVQIPDNTRAITIEARVNDVVTITYETIMSREMAETVVKLLKEINPNVNLFNIDPHAGAD